jgi:hypothetical protein
MYSTMCPPRDFSAQKPSTPMSNILPNLKDLDDHEHPETHKFTVDSMVIATVHDDII